jgi:hypothetical protein
MINRMLSSLAGILCLVTMSMPAFARTVGTVPEPGVLGLLGIGGVAAVAIALRNRNKKK